MNGGIDPLNPESLNVNRFYTTRYMSKVHFAMFMVLLADVAVAALESEHYQSVWCNLLLSIVMLD